MPTTDPNGQIVRAKDHAYEVESWLNAHKDKIAEMLPSIITPERLFRTAITTMRHTPDLMKCTKGSIVGGILQTAALGLEIGTGLGHAYLVPFKNKYRDRDGTWRQRHEATLIIGYKGYCDMAYRSSKVISVRARAVYKDDIFEYDEGLERTLRHKPSGNPANDEDLLYVYAIADMHDVPKEQSPWTCLDRATILKTRASSRGSQSKYSPWNTYFEMMARKTAIRRLVDKGEIPASAEMRKAAALDDQADTGFPQAFPDVDHKILDMDDWDEEPGEVVEGEHDDG